MNTKRVALWIVGGLMVALGLLGLLAMGATAGDANQNVAVAPVLICPPTATPYVTHTPPPPPLDIQPQVEAAKPQCVFVPQIFNSRTTPTQDLSPTMTPPVAP